MAESRLHRKPSGYIGQINRNGFGLSSTESPIQWDMKNQSGSRRPSALLRRAAAGG